MFPIGKAKDMLVWEFLHYYQTEAAGRALVGDLIFDINPGYLKVLLKFELLSYLSRSVP